MAPVLKIDALRSYFAFCQTPRVLTHLGAWFDLAVL